MDLLEILTTGITLKTSGTTGEPKEFYQSPSKLAAANQAAIVSQHLTSCSRVYTVCKTQHAGGLLAQTLPALSIGATVDIEPFNAYTWVRKIVNYTHSHITPAHGLAILSTKGFEYANLSGVWITCGSDSVSLDLIEAFVSRGATFMTNWGMTEIGPTAINYTFTSVDQVQAIKQQGHFGTLLGNTFYCDYKIVHDELLVKGDISIFENDWYATGDMVHLTASGELYHIGRKNT